MQIKRKGVLTIEIARRPDETEFEFHKRIVFGKLVDKTLSDYDYSELANIIYGKPYSSDVARRMLYGSRKTLELLESEGISSLDDKELISNIDNKIFELKKEQKKYYDQRREYNKLATIDGRAEHIMEILEKSANNLAQTVGQLYDNNSHINYEDGYHDSEAIIVFSDWHYGMVTNNIYNEYNTEICKNRIENVVNAAIDRIQLHKCETIHVVMLGDCLHGSIHNSTRVASEELVCDQLMQASEILAQSISRLSSFANKTEVYVTYGNHARTVADKKDNIHMDNMERIVGWWLKERFKYADSIRINESLNELLLLTVCGYNFCGVHGDLDSVKTSPQLLSTLFHKKYGIDLNYILLGDKHHYEAFDNLGITAMICGSLCGTDEYAHIKRLYSEPEQLMLIVNPVDGLDATYRLKCNTDKIHP